MLLQINFDELKSVYASSVYVSINRCIINFWTLFLDNFSLIELRINWQEA